jgi:hypothetical protein
VLVKTSKKNFELSGHVFQSQKMFEMISFWFRNVCVLKSDSRTYSSIVQFKNIWRIVKKIINNSWGKCKRNECLINVCKSVKICPDLHKLQLWFSRLRQSLFLKLLRQCNHKMGRFLITLKHSHPIFIWYTNSRLRLVFVYEIKIGCSCFN